MTNDTPSPLQKSTATNQTVKQRLESARTGYLSIPSHLPQAIKDNLLERVRKRLPHLRIGSFSTEFESRTDWRKHIASFLADVDVLIVAVDSMRRAGLGVGREIDQAMRAEKLIILFDIETGRYSRFFGFDVERGEDGRRTGIKLREAARPRATRERGK